MEGCGNNGGRGRGECVFCKGVCVERCRSSRWPGCRRAIAIEVRAPALFVCLGGGIGVAHSCEVVRCLAVA